MKSPRLLAGALSLLLVVGTSHVTRAQSFTHPGISHSQADLNRMKNNINVEPYKTAYAMFSSLGSSQSTNTGQGPFTSETYGHGQFEIRNDAQVAHFNAVMWYVTGNTAYRTNAINIMMGWANTLTSFDQSDIITAATAIFDFANAAEIIRATGNGAWAPTDITTFQNWLLTYLYPPILSPGNSIAANQLAPCGFGGLEMKGLISLGIFCDRRDIFNFGVSSLQHNGTYAYGLQEYVDATSGQNYENQRDQGHASGNIGTFTESFYMAYNQGTDLFPFASNLLAKAFELQAKFDLGWDVTPAVWTAADGSGHSDNNSYSRQPGDNLTSDLTYYMYHTVKGLAMPYTLLSSNAKFGALSFLYRVDNSGTVPVSPLVGQPADTDVAVFGNGQYSGWIGHFTAGNYPSSTFASHGANAAQASSIRVPAGWTVTIYSADNYAGNSAVLTASQPDLSSIGFNDAIYSLKVTAGGSYTVSNSTYKIINRNSGKVADVSGASTADGGSVISWPYGGAVNQIWRVQAVGGGQYSLLNLNSGKAMEVSGASLTNGAAIDQRTYVAPPNLATGGTASASSDNAANGEGAAQAFDGNNGTKWNSANSLQTGWLQYQFGGGKTYAVNQYTLTSAGDVQERDPAAWQLQGSNNGTTWTTVDTQTGQVFNSRGQTNSYSFTNSTAYAYYRLNISANYAGGGGYNLQLAEMNLYATATGGVQQRWTFAANPGSAYGTYLILQNVNSGQVLDGSGASNLVQKPQAYPSASYAQQWLLQVP